MHCDPLQELGLQEHHSGVAGVVYPVHGGSVLALFLLHDPHSGAGGFWIILALDLAVDVRDRRV